MNRKTSNEDTGFPFLFSPLHVGGVEVRNRLVALPVHTGFAHPDGRASTWMVKFYGKLAGSGTGMVIVANAAVSGAGVVSRFNLRADSEQMLPGLSRLADEIKKEGSVACLQLNHAGRFARTRHPMLPSPLDSAHLAFNVESLKDFMHFFPFEKRFNLTRYCVDKFTSWRVAMTQQDRDRIVRQFAFAARLAYRAGFDMVELHGANGYLLCQYLSLFTNKLTSAYGPDFKGRIRFPLEVIRAVKQQLPPGFPIGFRLLLKEWVPGGIELPEAVAFARHLEKAGISYLSVSAGTYNSIFSPGVKQEMARPSYLEQDTVTLKKAVGIPVVAAGRITAPLQAERLIQSGSADLIGLGRPLRADPAWVAKARQGGQRIIGCRNCNWCLKRVILEQGFCCSRWPGIEQEHTGLAHELLTRNFKTLWVISHPRDMETFRSCWPLMGSSNALHRPSRIIFLEPPGRDAFKAYHAAKVDEDTRADFLQWVNSSTLIPGSDSRDITVHQQVAPPHHWEEILIEEIDKEDPGHVFFGSEPGKDWQERILYKQRKRVMASLSCNPDFRRVIVPVDFSFTTLLALKFLQRTLMENPWFQFEFIHVAPDKTSGSVNPAAYTRQWERLRRIARFDADIVFKIVPVKGDVVHTLVRIIKEESFGTVVMGKRGLAGIKRWLLGSVSSGVLRQLTRETFFLVD
ncbi:MAG: hypothetical protein D3926_18420 [Desulfobacteraceae bacterium]|nr:MAG: hypothetical protein D3926_18420 [Desulfobacteraceae bacterium]